MRIAVTGATGRIGGQVVELLATQEDHQVVALSRPAAQHQRQSPRVITAEADYADLPALRAAWRDIDTLVFVSSDGVRGLTGRAPAAVREVLTRFPPG